MRRIRLLAALLATLAVAGCGGGSSSGSGAVTPGAGTPAGGGTASRLVVGYDREPDTLNRFSTHILEDIETCVVEGLVTTDEHMTIVPLLAASVPTLENGGVVLRNDGGMDVTWRLRPDVTWHDGTPHTSADVKFTVEAINSPAYNPESTDGFDRITSVDTPDALTAVLHYQEVYAPYALQFVRGTLPKHVLDGRDIDTANDYNRAPLGTGPYRVAEWKSGEYIRLEAAPNYWRGAQFPAIKTLLFKFIPNTNTRINQLKSGEVDMVVMFPWDKHREVAAIPGVAVHKIDGNGYEHVTLNQRAFPAFADVRVRQALTHAVDRALISTTILEGLAPVTHGPVQPVSWAHNPKVRQYALRSSAGRGAARRGRLARQQRRRRARQGRPALQLHAHHPGRLCRARERGAGAAAPVQGRGRGGRRATARRHQHQQVVVRGQVPRDVALVAVAGRSGAGALLREGPHAARRPQHQLRER